MGVSISFLQKKAVFQIVFIVWIVQFSLFKAIIMCDEVMCFSQIFIQFQDIKYIKITKVAVHNELISKGKVYTVP